MKQMLVAVLVLMVVGWFTVGAVFAQTTNAVFSTRVLTSVDVGGVQTRTNLVETTFDFTSDVLWQVKVFTNAEFSGFGRPVARADYELRTLSPNRVVYWAKPSKDRFYFRATGTPLSPLMAAGRVESSDGSFESVTVNGVTTVADDRGMVFSYKQ